MLRHVIAVVVIAATLGSLPAQDKARKEPLVDRVQKAIAGGVRYLRGMQRANGSWEVTGSPENYEGGSSALTLIALLNAGVPKSDPAIAAALRYVRAIDSPKVYVRALQTVALAEAGFAQDRQLLQQNVQWLLDARAFKSGKLIGWSYEKRATAGFTDNSNTQYAMLGLWAGRQAGIAIARDVWEGIREYYARTQDEAGAWMYSPEWGPQGHDRPSLTMTTAGLCGLLIAGMELNSGREQLQPDGTATNCGSYVEGNSAAKALHWLGRHITVSPEQAVFYNLYGIERAGRLSGLRFFGEHDWYREGSDHITRLQHPDGSWHLDQARNSWDRWPVVSTSFALLFLSKGRTPVLVSKLVHGEWNPALRGGPRSEADMDWNNDRNDLRNLVPFVSKELYKDLPLAWQTFDLMRAASAHPGPAGALSDDQEAEVTAELLQSPIAYITGHRSPRLRFTAVEKRLLQRYIENGGFILAEACCGSPAFDKGIKELVDELWPGYELTPLEGTHPVWTSFFTIAPGDPYQLMGLSMGCKTVLIYSPQDLSCQWESNRADTGRGQLAFRLGANVVAYATGREPPRPRLTQVAVASHHQDSLQQRRGYFQVGQVYHGGDWHPAPRAMPNLMDYVNKVYGLDVVLKTDKVLIGDRSVVDAKFLYMHGRGEFRFQPEQLEHLRFNLDNGGLLLADACCGKEAFDKSFRKFVAELLPGKKLERVPLDDDLFSAGLSGRALTNANIRLRTRVNGPLQSADPWLEGVKVNGRWAVLYSKYDIGCALERHQSSDCLGYDPDSALKIAAAAVLYNLRP
jgi:hypothetical protein